MSLLNEINGYRDTWKKGKSPYFWAFQPNPATNKTRTHDTIQWFPHNDSVLFVPGTATTTNLLLLELIDTLNGTQDNAPSTNDVPALICQVWSLLHKKGMLSNAPQSNEPVTLTKGGLQRPKRTATAFWVTAFNTVSSYKQMNFHAQK